jgi:hypothetical protein
MRADAPHPIRLLCPHRERPRCGGAAEKCDEFPSPMASPAQTTTSGIKRISHFEIENCAERAGAIRFGSKADMALCNRDVRFTPESGHGSARS